MADISLKPLFFSLIGLGLFGMVLSIIVICLSLMFGSLYGGFILIMVGLVNTILHGFPLSLGLVGVYAEMKKDMFCSISAFFYCIALPNMCALGFISIGLMGEEMEGIMARVYYIILIIIYLVEIIISGICISYLCKIESRSNSSNKTEILEMEEQNK